MKPPKDYKLIGRGQWTKVFHKEGDENVHMISTCCVKECMANGWFPNSSFFPVIKHSKLEWFDYESTYYAKVKAPKRVLTAESYATYQMLRDLAEFIRIASRGNEAYYTMRDIFNTKIQDEYLRNTLQGALFGLANYSKDIGFEISPRNIASNNGQLILLDCFFVREYK